MTDFHAELVKRVTLLDEWSAKLAPHLGSDDPRTVTRVGRDLLRVVVEGLGYHSNFLRDAVTDAATRRARGTPRYVTPGAADAVVASSRTLAALQRWTPEIVTGPVNLAAQQWVSHGRTDGPPSHPDTVAVAADDHVVGDKPAWCGIYTSTGVFDNTSMWQAYLRHGTDGSLLARPWRAWSVTPAPDVRVREVTTAAEWAGFVCRYGVAVDGVLAPDWRRVSRRYDAVHMTVRAVLATHEVPLATDRGLIVPTHWDVESTLWLDWPVRSYTLIGEIGAA